MKENLIKYQFIKKLENLPFIEQIWLFGSRARGDNRERSDIDIAILCPDATDRDWLQVVDIIDNADTLLKIDCLRLENLFLDSDLRNNIIKEKIVLYVKNKT